MSDSRITVRLSPELRRRLKEAARRRRVRESDFVRDAVEREVGAVDEAGEGSAYDAALTAGLIGAVREAPPDLSVDPKHFHGFGRS